MSEDDRLREVERTLAVLVDRVERVLASMDHTARRDSCPHGDDFIKILEALGRGGKRFDELESTVSDTEPAGLGYRVNALEHEQLSTRAWLKGAIAVVAAGSALIGWLMNEVIPVLGEWLTR